MNLAELLLKSLIEKDGDQPFIYYQQKNYSGQEIQRLTTQLVWFLKKQNVSPDDRVLLLLNDSPFYICTFLATIAMGAIPVPINPRTQKEGLNYILNDSRAKAIFVENYALEDFKSINNEYLKKEFVFSEEIVNYTIENQNAICSLEKKCSKECSFSTIKFYQKKNNSVAFWQYTSGTTGQPKAVLQSNELMLLNVENFAKNTLKIDENDIIMSVPKMFFGYGLGNTLFFSMLCKASVVIEPEWFELDTFLRNIQLYKPTICFALPKVYSLILANLDKINKSDFQQIRVFYSAGAHLPKELNERWKKVFGNYILDGIGSTEIGHVFISNIPQTPTPWATGYPVAGYDVKICDENENQVLQGQKGELWVKPTVNLLGYWENNIANQTKFKDGWYKTGDVFVQNNDNSFSYLSRKDDLFKINGRWVVPAEIERLVLANFTMIEECALLGIADEEGHTMAVLYVVTKYDMENLEEEIKLFLKSQTDSYKVPKKLIQGRMLSKNENGKLERHKLIDTVKAQLLQADLEQLV